MTKFISFDQLFPHLAGNKLQAYLLLVICISAFGPEPLNALIYGLSGDGKSHLVDVVLKLIPKEKIVYLSTITHAALSRLPDDYLKNKVVVIPENHGKDKELLFMLRLLKTDGFFERAYTGKDGETIIKRISGPITVIQTTSSDLNKFEEDDKNRDCIFTVDSGREQKQRILKLNADRAAGKRTTSTTELQSKMQQYLRNLPWMKVIIPYAEHITPKIYTNRGPRIQKQSLQIIMVVAILNSPFRKAAFHNPEQTTIEATLYDYEVAYELFKVAFETQVTTKSSLKIYLDHIKDGIQKTGGYIFTRSDVQEWTNLKSTSAKNKIKELISFGIIEVHTQHKSNKPAQYKLSSKDSMDDKPFISPQELRSILVKNKSDQHK